MSDGENSNLYGRGSAEREVQYREDTLVKENPRIKASYSSLLQGSLDWHYVCDLERLEIGSECRRFKNY